MNVRERRVHSVRYCRAKYALQAQAGYAEDRKRFRHMCTCHLPAIAEVHYALIGDKLLDASLDRAASAAASNPRLIRHIILDKYFNPPEKTLVLDDAQTGSNR